MQGFNALREFYNKEGHTLVPQNYKEDDFHNLNAWPDFIATQLLYELYERWYRMERPRKPKLGTPKFGALIKKIAQPSRPGGMSAISIDGNKRLQVGIRIARSMIDHFYAMHSGSPQSV